MCVCVTLCNCVSNTKLEMLITARRVRIERF